MEWRPGTCTKGCERGRWVDGKFRKSLPYVDGRGRTCTVLYGKGECIWCHLSCGCRPSDYLCEQLRHRLGGRRHLRRGKWSHGRVLFSQAGTYLQFFRDGSVELSYWRWEDKANGVIYAYDFGEEYDGALPLPFSMGIVSMCWKVSPTIRKKMICWCGLSTLRCSKLLIDFDRGVKIIKAVLAVFLC